MRALLTNIARYAVIPAFISLCAGACAFRQDKGGSAPGSAHNNSLSPSFAQVRDQVFAVKCTSCHVLHHQNDFTDYAKTATDSAEIQQKVFVDRTMPQGDTLSADQSSLLKAWLDAGTPEQAQQPNPTSTATSIPMQPPEPTWDNVQKHFFAPYCTHCHSGDAPKADLDLTDLDQIRPISDKIMDRVFFNAEKPMPPGKPSRDKMTAEEKMLLIGWIAAKMPAADGSIPQPTPIPSSTPSAPAPTPPVALPVVPVAVPSVAPSAVPAPPLTPAPIVTPAPAPTIEPVPPITLLVPNFEMLRSQVFSVSCTTCHYHSTDFTDYADTFAERSDIQQNVLVNHTMPKTGALSTGQISLLQLWLAGGAIE